MTTIISRSFADAFGLNWPKDWASVVDGKPIMFSEIRAARIEKQKNRLKLIRRREGAVRTPAHIWTFFVPGPFYGGWHLYLRTLRNAWWLGGDHCAIKEDWPLIEKIMKQFPCGVLPWPENFYIWKEAFAKTYPRPSAKGARQGVMVCWVDIHAGKGRPCRDEIYFQAGN